MLLRAGSNPAKNPMETEKIKPCMISDAEMSKEKAT